MSSFWHKLKGLGKKAVKTVTKTFTDPGSAIKELGSSAVLAGLGVPTVPGAGSSLVDMAGNVDWQREGYRFLEGYIPGTDINPIDRYLGRDIADKNFQYQKDAYEYQKWLNDQQMLREDTAYQRKLNDMTAAGFNPILAAGGSGLSTTALRAGSPPQLADTSGALREGIGQVLGIMTGFAGLNKTKAETALLKSQRENQDIINAHEAEYLKERNAGMKLANNFSESTLPTRIDLIIGDKTMQDKRLLHADFENELARLGVTSAELDNIYKRLGVDDMELKIKLDTLALLYKTEEYEAYKYSRDFYENQYHVPTGFNMSSLFGALTAVGNRLGPQVKSFLKSLFGGEDKPRNPSGFGGTGASRDFVVDNFIPFDENYASGPSLESVLRSFVSSCRRGADGVRRNQYSVLFK